MHLLGISRTQEVRKDMAVGCCVEQVREKFEGLFSIANVLRVRYKNDDGLVFKSTVLHNSCTLCGSLRYNAMMHVLVLVRNCMSSLSIRRTGSPTCRVGRSFQTA